MSTTVPARFRVRRDSAADWTAVNPVLLLGEPALETDTGKVKYGDGATAWNALAYAAGSVLDPDLAAIAALAGTGLAVRTAANSWAQRTITGTAGEIAVANGSGAGGNPTLSLASPLALAGKTVTGGVHLVGATFDRIRFQRTGVGDWYLGNATAGGAGNGFALVLNATSAFEMTTTSQAQFKGSLRIEGHGTTASGANAHIDSATGLVSRSTSSLAYKREVEDLDPAAADRLLDVRTIWYRSAIATDRPDWSWWGIAAEELAAIDPRLVHWGYLPADYDRRFRERRLRKNVRLRPVGVSYDRLTVPILNLVQRLEKRLAAAEAEIARLTKSQGESK